MKGGAFIGRLARAAGVNVQTVRYYERLGLLPSAARTPAGYRVYSGEGIERLQFIRRAQAVGFRLNEIKEVLRLRYGGQSPCECVREKLSAKLAQVEREMVELAHFRRRLRRMLKDSEKYPRLPHSASAICPIIEAHNPRQRARSKAGRGRRSGRGRRKP